MAKQGNYQGKQDLRGRESEGKERSQANQC